MLRGKQNVPLRLECVYEILTKELGARDGDGIHVAELHRVLIGCLEIGTDRSVKNHAQLMVARGYVWREGHQYTIRVPPRLNFTPAPVPKGRPPKASRAAPKAAGVRGRGAAGAGSLPAAMSQPRPPAASQGAA